MVETGEQRGDRVRVGVGILMIIIGTVVLFSMILGNFTVNMPFAVLALISLILGSLLIGTSVSGRVV